MNDNNLPLFSDFYGQPPYLYRDSWSMTVFFKTSEQFLQKLLPAPLSLSAEPIMFVTINQFFSTTFGHYNELFIGSAARFGEREVNHSAFLLLDSDTGVAAGREIWGFPKKLGRILLERKDGIITGIAERGGQNLVKMNMNILGLGEAEELASSPDYTNYKHIPNVKAGAKPDVQQLTVTTVKDLDFKQIYKGDAKLEFGGSATDDLSQIPVEEVIAGFYYNWDLTLDSGDVLHDYLQES